MTQQLRIKGKRFLITWAHHNVDDLEEIHTFLNGIGTVKFARIAREHHQDGDIHIHAYVEYERALDRRNTRLFDHNGKHPNVKPKRTKKEWTNAYTYIEKEYAFEDFGENPQTEEEPENVNIVERARQSVSYEEYLNWGQNAGVPFGFVREAWNIASRSPPTTFQEGDVIGGTISLFALQHMVFDPNTRKALVIEGDTGIGKSVWAKTHAPRPALLVSDIDDLKHLRRDYHRSIIFDDVSFAHIPRNIQIHLLDFDTSRTIRCRYINCAIPEGMHRIFTCNYGYFPFLEGDAAIDRRITRVSL